MKIKIKILTPVHIGSGAEITPSEYFIENGKFFRINMDSLFQDSEFLPFMDKFIEIAKTQRYIGDILPQPLLKKHILYSISVTKTAFEYIQKNRTVVKEHIKTAGNVFIPGSSLKGSIFSGVFWYYLKESYHSNNTYTFKDRGTSVTLPANEFITQALQGRYRYDDLLNFAFTRFTRSGKNKFAGWLGITDTDTKEPSDCLQLSLAKVEGSRSGSQLPILYETLKPGIEFSFEIKKNPDLIIDEVGLLKIVDEFYKKVLEKDRVEIRSSGKIIRLGQGSTAYSTSCLILAEELGIKNYQVKPPTTRKRVDEILPMGWAEMTVE
jgi:CRISPR-associated protein Csm5